MSYDIEKFVGDSHAIVKQQQLGFVGSQVEKREQAKHIAALQRVRRETEISVAYEGRSLITSAARMERISRAATEAKFKLHRAKKESQLIADEDLELSAKFAAIDDDLFQHLRIELQRDGLGTP